MEFPSQRHKLGVPGAQLAGNLAKLDDMGLKLRGKMGRLPSPQRENLLLAGAFDRVVDAQGAAAGSIPTARIAQIFITTGVAGSPDRL
jgi:hypothetical protein